jgi:hypothetical protein
MDNLTAATLKDCNDKIEEKFENIKKALIAYDNATESSEKSKLNSKIESDFGLVEVQLSMMKNEIEKIKNEGEYRVQKDKTNKYKQEVKRLREQLNEKKNKNTGNNLYLDEIKPEMNQQQKGKFMTVQEGFDRGDAAINDADDAIIKMGKKANDMKNIGTEIQKEQQRQQERLGIVKKDLGEIVDSTKRANQDIKTMFKMYATDKLIMCLIIFILLIILTIIIIAAVGGDKEKKFNVPHDIFVSSSNTTKTTAI